MTNDYAKQNGHLLQSVDNALSILETFTVEHPEWGITELSEKHNLAKSTIYRLIHTLSVRGYVKQNPTTKKYHLGWKLLEIGNIAAEQSDLRDLARPHLQKLLASTNETVHLAVVDGTSVVYIDKLESAQKIRMRSRIGHHAPLHCTAVGKALLAFEPPETVTRVVASGLEAYTAKTITDSEVLRRELKTIRQRGYALDDREFDDELRCVAAPIRDNTGAVVASIGIAGLAARIDFERRRDFIDVVIQAADGVSRDFGYRSYSENNGSFRR